MRAPLRAINGFSQLLAEGYGDQLGEEGENYLARVHENAMHMNALLDGLLLLSRVTRSDKKCEEVNLSAMVREICDRLSDGESGRKANFEIEPELVVVGDPHLLWIALENLLENAWKFSQTSRKHRLFLDKSNYRAKLSFIYRTMAPDSICVIKINCLGLSNVFTPSMNLRVLGSDWRLCPG